MIKPEPRLLRDDPTIITFFICLGAVFIGLFIATQAVMTTIILLGAVLLGVMIAITPLAAFMVMLVLSPLRTLIATEAALQLPLDIGQMGVIVLVGAWFITHVAASRPVLRFTWSDIYIPVGVFVAVAGLTAFNAASISAWLNEWLKWLLMLALITLVLHIGQGRRWEWLVLGLVLAGVGNAVVGIYIFFGGSGALHLLVLGRFFRAFGTFGQPNPFGGFMGLLAPITLMMAAAYGLLLWRGWQNKKHLRRNILLAFCFYGAAAGLIVMALFMSWSRGAWLGFGLSMAVLIFAAPRRLWVGALLIGLAGICFAGVWSTGWLPTSVTERIASATQEIFVLSDVRAVDITPENYAIVERLAHWQAALNMARDSAWLGVGLGNYENVYETYRLINWREPLGHAHNYYLNVLAEAGIIGFVGYIFMLATLVLFTWRLRKHPDDFSRLIGVGLLGTWVYLLAHSLTDNLYVNNLFLHIGVMLGVLAVLHGQISAKIISSSSGRFAVRSP